MIFLFRKYKKINNFLIYVHNSKTTYIKKTERVKNISYLLYMHILRLKILHFV